MYTKEELESMAIPELMGVADELGVKVSQDDSLETVVYAILDKAAEDSAANTDAPKRKRTRIQKKDSSRVYKYEDFLKEMSEKSEAEEQPESETAQIKNRVLCPAEDKLDRLIKVLIVKGCLDGNDLSYIDGLKEDVNNKNTSSVYSDNELEDIVSEAMDCM